MEYFQHIKTIRSNDDKSYEKKAPEGFRTPFMFQAIEPAKRIGSCTKRVSLFPVRAECP